MDIYTTASVPQAARASYWNELYSRRFAQVTFGDARRNADVAERELGHKGVRRQILPPAVEVVAEALDDLQAEGELRIRGIGSVQK